MKHYASMALGVCAAISLAVLSEPVQPPVQPNTLPPSALPPGSPLPTTPRGIDVGSNTEIKRNSASAVSSESDARLAAEDQAKQLGKNSASFTRAALQDGMLEIELGKLAAAKGSNRQIRDFGKHLANDNERTVAELKKAAKAAKVDLSDDLDAEHKAKLATIKGKSGVAFDAAYAEAIAQDQEKALTLFREAITATGVDPGLQAFAKRTLPTLEEHSSTARQLHTGLAALAPAGKS